MFVIGTAGHVDHGKSTLVRALTGIDPDRLAEEKAREMTIDLGFAWLQLDGIQDEIGVVDVPGHRDFIENMLAGVGGIDLALFVVAADEGVMPQTREHLAILDLLEIQRGIVAITKTDMIDDDEWLELVTLEIAEAFEGTILEDAPMLHVSAHTGAGLVELKATLIDALQKTAPKADTGRPRLAVDRVFTISGFGTVVTGTLIGGQLRIGDDVVMQPDGLTGRVRGLQTHKTKLEVARPGSRVAVNVSGIEKNEARRGAVVTREDVIRPTLMVDTYYKHLADADAPLKHNAEVKFFVGSAEIVARARILGKEQIEPGQHAFVQLALREPAAIVRGDRFILRRPSPGATLGGGRILDPAPGRRHKRFRPDTLSRLQTLAQGTPAELILQTVRRNEPVTPAALQKATGLQQSDFNDALEQSLHEGLVVRLEKQIVSAETWVGWQSRVETILRDFHREKPLRLGMSREEVRSRLKLKAVVFNQLVGETGVAEEGSLLRVEGHEVVFSAEQQQKINTMLRTFQKASINAPSVKQAQETVGSEVYQAMLDLGQLTQISKDVVWRTEDLNTWLQVVYVHLCQHEKISAADLRDLLQTSRKYAIGLLEYLDKKRVTRRVDDVRVLVTRNGICQEE